MHNLGFPCFLFFCMLFPFCRIFDGFFLSPLSYLWDDLSLYPSLPLWAVLIHKLMSSFHADDFQNSMILPPSIRMGISSCNISLGIICCQHELSMVKRDANVFSAPRWQHFSWLLFTQSCFLPQFFCLLSAGCGCGGRCLYKVREIKLLS